jgi:hypothetical protein
MQYSRDSDQTGKIAFRGYPCSVALCCRDVTPNQRGGHRKYTQKNQATHGGEWPVLAKSSGEEGNWFTCSEASWWPVRASVQARRCRPWCSSSGEHPRGDFSRGHQ